MAITFYTKADQSESISLILKRPNKNKRKAATPTNNGYELIIAANTKQTLANLHLKKTFNVTSTDNITFSITLNKTQDILSVLNLIINFKVNIPKNNNMLRVIIAWKNEIEQNQKDEQLVKIIESAPPKKNTETATNQKPITTAPKTNAGQTKKRKPATVNANAGLSQIQPAVKKHDIKATQHEIAIEGATQDQEVEVKIQQDNELLTSQKEFNKAFLWLLLAEQAKNISSTIENSQSIECFIAALTFSDLVPGEILTDTINDNKEEIEQSQANVNAHKHKSSKELLISFLKSHSLTDPDKYYLLLKRLLLTNKILEALAQTINISDKSFIQKLVAHYTKQTSALMQVALELKEFQNYLDKNSTDDIEKISSDLWVFFSTKPNNIHLKVEKALRDNFGQLLNAHHEKKEEKEKEKEKARLAAAKLAAEESEKRENQARLQAKKEQDNLKKALLVNSCKAIAEKLDNYAKKRGAIDLTNKFVTFFCRNRKLTNERIEIAKALAEALEKIDHTNISSTDVFTEAQRLLSAAIQDNLQAEVKFDYKKYSYYGSKSMKIITAALESLKTCGDDKSLEAPTTHSLKP